MGEDEKRERKGMGGVQMKTMHSCMDGWREEGLGRGGGRDWDVGLD